MSLLKQWQKKHLQLPANAIPAIPASNEGETMPRIAAIAEIAIANPENEAKSVPTSTTPRIAKIAEIAIATPPEPTKERDKVGAKRNEWKRKGLSDAEAEKMAEVLAERERLLDDRRACIECQHSYMKRCKASLTPIGHSTIYTLHRCKGFIEG